MEPNKYFVVNKCSIKASIIYICLTIDSNNGLFSLSFDSGILKPINIKIKNILVITNHAGIFLFNDIFLVISLIVFDWHNSKIKLSFSCSKTKKTKQNENKKQEVTINHIRNSKKVLMMGDDTNINPKPIKHKSIKCQSRRLLASTHASNSDL